MTRILISGSRSWKASALAARVIDRLVRRYGAENLIIVHGGATGVDAAFDVAAKAAGVAVEPHPADWETYGKGAGPRRNAEMVQAGAVLCLAIHKSIKFSKGTRVCAMLAINAGIPTYLIDSDNGEPKRLEKLP